MHRLKLRVKSPGKIGYPIFRDYENMRKQCFSILSGYFTLTTWYNVYVLPPLVTVILIVALPFLTALTLPFLETLATFLLDVAYLTVAPLARFANLIFLDLPFLRTVSSATARFFPA